MFWAFFDATTGCYFLPVVKNSCQCIGKKVERRMQLLFSCHNTIFINFGVLISLFGHFGSYRA